MSSTPHCTFTLVSFGSLLNGCSCKEFRQNNKVLVLFTSLSLIACDDRVIVSVCVCVCVSGVGLSVKLS